VALLRVSAWFDVAGRCDRAVQPLPLEQGDGPGLNACATHAVSLGRAAGRTLSFSAHAPPGMVQRLFLLHPPPRWAQRHVDGMSAEAISCGI